MIQLTQQIMIISSLGLILPLTIKRNLTVSMMNVLDCLVQGAGGLKKNFTCVT